MKPIELYLFTPRKAKKNHNNELLTVSTILCLSFRYSPLYIMTHILLDAKPLKSFKTLTEFTASPTKFCSEVWEKHLSVTNLRLITL